MNGGADASLLIIAEKVKWICWARRMSQPGWRGHPSGKVAAVWSDHRPSAVCWSRAVDPVVAIMEVFDPVVPFIIATFFMSLLLSIGLAFGSCGLVQSAVSAPLGEGSSAFRNCPHPLMIPHIWMRLKHFRPVPFSTPLLHPFAWYNKIFTISIYVLCTALQKQWTVSK